MNKEEFIRELKKINIELTQLQLNQFEIYYNFLKEYNIHTNLTTIIEEPDVYLKHFYDSILLSVTTDLTKIKTMLDVGCGAGFPGMVIGIIYPNIKITLLDSNNKKTTFCKCLKEKLNLKNINIINERAEEYIKNKREYFDLVTARAVKNLQVLTELCIPYVKENGYFIAMKSNYEEELSSSLKKIELLGAKFINVINKDLPNNSGSRNFIKIKKINKTNKLYPRKYNIILKRPL